MEGSLVDGAVSEETKRGSFEALVFQAVSEAEAEGGLAGDDTMSAPEVFVGCDEVHRSAFALGATGGFSVKFGHALVHVHADGESVGVTTIGGDHVIVRPHERGGADGDRFLANVEVKESTYFPAIVLLEGGLLKTADTDHLPVVLDLVFSGQAFVDGRTRKVER